MLIRAPRRTLVTAALLVAAPIVIQTAYLWTWLTCSLGNRGVWDYVAISVSVAVGLIGVSRLQGSRTQRLIRGLFYIPAAVLVLFLWSLIFVCEQFDLCL